MKERFSPARVEFSLELTKWLGRKEISLKNITRGVVRRDGTNEKLSREKNWLIDLWLRGLV